MTMEQAMPPPEEVFTPDFYWTARRMDEQKTAATKAINKGIDRASDEWFQKIETMQRALGLSRQRDPRVRLAAYYQKPETYQEALELFSQGLLKVIYSWESQQAYFPRDWEDDWEDFQKLRQRALDGDFGAELQAQEVAYASMPIMPPPSNGELGGAVQPPPDSPPMESEGLF